MQQLICMLLFVAIVSLQVTEAQITTGCIENRAGLTYTGTQSVTSTSKDCIAWSLTPFRSSDSLFPDNSVANANNFCRNPGFSRNGLWCYTNASSLEWDFCASIPVCVTNCRRTESGKEYNGEQSKDANGVSCLSWASVTSKISTEFFRYDANLVTANSYCRNVQPNVSNPFDLHPTPWCYINPSTPTISACNIAFCSQQAASGCRDDLLGVGYRGNQSVSVSGQQCMSWNATGAFASGTAWPLADESLDTAGNKCRNPNASPVGLWCYVADNEWRPCSVPVCAPLSSCPGSNTSSYFRYRLSQINRSCSDWSSVYSSQASNWYDFTASPPAAAAVRTQPLFHAAHLPDASLSEAAAYCRNPDSDAKGPWCPSAEGTKIYCSNPCSNATCLTAENATDYIGRINVTRRGVPCQPWERRYPWPHSFGSTGNFPDLSVEDARTFCRNPNGNPYGPWCIKAGNITDSDYWDFCDVPFCAGVARVPAASPALRGWCLNSTAGTEYAGTHPYSASGRLCQRWDAQSPHPHPFYLPQMFNELTIPDANNYCRNPNHDPNGPWCYTADPNVRFEYCNIVLCHPTIIYPAAVESFLQLVGSITMMYGLLSSLAMAIVLSNILIKCPCPSSQQDSKESNEPEFNHSHAANDSRIEADDELFDIDADQIVAEKQQQMSAEPDSNFSHNNAVMKSMANGFDQDPFSDTLQPITEEEEQQPIRDEEIIEARLRETETLERQLDFDQESWNSLSLPRARRQKLQQQQQQQPQQQQQQKQAMDQELRSTLAQRLASFEGHAV